MVERRRRSLVVRPNVRAKPTTEAGGVSLGCDDASWTATQAYDGCRSGSALERGVRPRLMNSGVGPLDPWLTLAHG